MTVNKSGYIPLPNTIHCLGEDVYFIEKREKNIMHKYDGIGISEVILKMMDESKKILIKIVEWNRYFLIPVKLFCGSNKIWINDKKDKQRFISFDDMVEVKFNDEQL